MKHKLVSRIFAITITLSLMMLALPASPALALPYSVNVENNNEASDYYEEPMGTIGDTIRVYGTGIGGLEISIYFSSQEADVGDDLDIEVTAYEWLASATVNILSEAFNFTTLTVPAQLIDGVDDEDVHGGIYYVYITRYNQDDIKAVATFTVTGVAEITSVAPIEGPAGTEVEIGGQGFAANEVITIEYDGDVLAIESGDVTNSNGAFILTVIIPESVFGDHTITAIGQDSLAEFEAVFTVEPEITISPDEGPSATFVTITGTGFDGNGDVVIYFGGDEVKTKRAGSNGSFDTFFAVPDVAPGSYDLMAEDVNNVAIWAEAVFSVTVIVNPAITVSPEEGPSGTFVTVAGTDFSANKNIYFYFDGAIVGTAATNANGDFTGATFNVPASSLGSHTVKAEDADGNWAEAVFTVTVVINPAITVSPTSGVADDEVTVTGTGFSANKNIYFYFDSAIVGTAATDANGDFTGTLTVPASAKGAHTIKAEDADGNLAEAMFTITANPEITISPTSGILGDQVTVSGSNFAASSTVTITFDGTSVGSTTANANGDFTGAIFIVPASAKGTHTIKAQDSAGNFATGTFTILPNMSITPTSGLVGDTVSVSGSGFSASSSVTITFDGTSVGTAATDASGNFTAIFNIPASANGVHTIRAQDSVGNFATATFTIGEEIAITPTSGIIGDTVTVSGSGFSASSSVTITFDGTSVGTTTTNVNGNFTGVIFNVPASANGAHTIRAQDSAGNFATATFTTGEQMSITPTSGLVGSQITVSGSGFGGGKSIDIYLDDVLISVSAATADANGDFSGTFTIPASSGGSHAIKALDSDGNLAIATLTVEQKMTVTPTTGAFETTVTVSGTGFGVAKSISITYNGEAVTTSPAVILTDASGTFIGFFFVPANPAGSYTVVASDGTLSDSADFVVIVEAAISAISGNVGDEVVVSGTGFKANTTVTVTYEAEPDALTTATTDSQGSFSVAITIPPSAGGAHAITATDGETTEQFTFVMEQAAPPTPQPLLPLGGDKPEQPVQFDWADVIDPSLPLTYTLQIARDENFTDMVLERTGLTESEYTMAEEEKLESTKKESPYYWRVKAIDGASNESGWTGAGSFDIGGSIWPAIPAWVRYLLLGLGILVVVVVGFWLGLRRAYSSF